MLLFGGSVIRDFNLALLFGIAVGTYSSVCVAVPLLLYMRLDRRSMLGVDRKEEGGAAASQRP
jgi:preprotein translocase subunit SecF